MINFYDYYTPFGNLQLLGDAYLDSIAAKHKNAGIIILDALSIFEDNNIEDSKKRNFMVSDWSFYDTKEKKIIYQVTIKNNLSTNYNCVFGAKDSYAHHYLLIEEAAMLYIHHIAPSYIPKNRFIYSNGSDELKNAFALFKSKEFKSAIKILENQVAKGIFSKKTYKKLTHNLAILHEIEGNYETALNWVKLSVSNGNAPSLRYMKELEIIVKNQPLVQFQLMKN